MKNVWGTQYAICLVVQLLNCSINSQYHCSTCYSPYSFRSNGRVASHGSSKKIARRFEEQSFIRCWVMLSATYIIIYKLDLKTLHVKRSTLFETAVLCTSNRYLHRLQEVLSYSENIFPLYKNLEGRWIELDAVKRKFQRPKGTEPLPCNPYTIFSLLVLFWKV
jgi:hypothetical protein